MNSKDINGRYFGTKSTPNEADQDKYVFLPAAGLRYGTGWSSVGSNGVYWSNTPNGSLAYYLYFDSGNITPGNNNLRNYGFPVRCVRDK